MGHVEHLGDLTRGIVNPPVRLVKTIGDAVMLICPDPVKLVDAMLGVVGGGRTRRDSAGSADRYRIGLGGEPRPGLVRQPGQCCQSHH